MTRILVPFQAGQTGASVSSVMRDQKLKVTGKDCFSKTRTQLPVCYHVVSHVPFAGGSPQKKGVIPECQRSIKSVKGVSCVNHLSSVQNVTNVPLVVPNPPVGSRLHKFWEKWAALGVNPKVVSVLKEGYILPFRSRPYLTREPTITSCYVDPHRNSYLLEALHQLLNKNAVELVQNPQSLGFYNRLFLVPKPNNRWRPILDLSKLNNFLKTQTFKMETPETIRTSLQAGEWVTSIDFKDAYFHVPINSQSRKYMRFHIQGKTYQFKALPFDLFTAPMEFTVIAKEVKWLAMRQGIRIHQYLDDWLVRARSLQVCRQQTQSLVTLCKDLGWLVNQEKSELEPKQIFNFVGYQFDLKQGRVRPTQERWQGLQVKIREILVSPVCPVRNFMSLIGLLTATEKTGSYGQTTHEAYTVAPQEQLEDAGNVGEGHSHSKITSPTSEMVAGGRQCDQRSSPTPSSTCSANLYRRIKRRVGRSLKRTYGKGTLVTPREQTAHKLPRVKGSPSGLKRISSLLYKQSGSHSYRQHHGGSIYKQGRGNEVGPTVCPIMEDTDMVCQKSSNTQSSTYSRPSKCYSRQVIQTGSDHSNRMIPQSRDIQGNMRPVEQTPRGPICHQVQQQTATLRLPSPRPPSLGSGCSQSVLGGTRPLRLSTSSHLGQSGGEAPGLPLQQNNSDCSRVAQHALVLGPGSNVKPDPTVSAQHTQPSVSAIQPGPSQEPVESEPTCLAPRASAIKEQGFSEAVAA